MEWVNILSERYLLALSFVLFCVYCIVQCSELTDPLDGTISCSLGDDGIPSYEDTCSFTCNNGYELTGSDTRTCQSDGSWSGSDDVCRRGILFIYYVFDSVN